MLKNILIYLIVFLFLIVILFDEPVKENFITNNENTIVYNQNNFEMDNTSIIMSSNTNLTKDECFNKVNKKDINGASFDLKKNICTLYFFAKKGQVNKNIESIL